MDRGMLTNFFRDKKSDQKMSDLVQNQKTKTNIKPIKTTI